MQVTELLPQYEADALVMIDVEDDLEWGAAPNSVRSLFSWDCPSTLTGWFEDVVRHYDSLSSRALTDAENAVATRFDLPSFFVFDRQRQPKWCDDLHRRERLVILHVLDMVPELVPIHGLSVSVNGVGLLLPSASGAGKSTLGASLASSGFRVLSDDISWCDPSGVLLPFPRSLALKRNASAGAAANSLPSRFTSGLTEVFRCEDAVYFRPRRTSGTVELAETPELRSILFLDPTRAGEDDPVFEISSGEALVRLGEECLDLEVRQESRLRDLCKLIDRTPCFRMARLDVASMVDRLQALAEGLAA